MAPLRRARSSPFIAAASNLRQFSLDRHRISPEPKVLEKPPQPMYEILADLKGCNGNWKKERAKEEWERQMKLKKEYERIQKIKEERARIRRAEEMEKMRKLAEYERMKKEEELERQKKLEREAQERKRAAEERERQRRLQQERLERLQQPRTCDKCAGCGECSACNGKGYFPVSYLSANVGSTTAPFFGRTRRGCESCGGFREDEDGNTISDVAGELRKPTTSPDFLLGTGRCPNCDGTGKTVLSKQEIKRLMALGLDEPENSNSPSKSGASPGQSKSAKIQALQGGPSTIG